jgi:hypothetical protein
MVKEVGKRFFGKKFTLLFLLDIRMAFTAHILKAIIPPFSREGSCA